MNLMSSEQTLGQKLWGSRRRLVQGYYNSLWWICPVSVAYSALFCRSGSGQRGHMGRIRPAPPPLFTTGLRMDDRRLGLQSISEIE